MLKAEGQLKEVDAVKQREINKLRTEQNQELEKIKADWQEKVNGLTKEIKDLTQHIELVTLGREEDDHILPPPHEQHLKIKELEKDVEKLKQRETDLMTLGKTKDELISVLNAQCMRMKTRLQP